MSRFACAWVDDFAAAAAARAEPALREQPLVIVGTAARATAAISRVLDASAAARAAGVRPGMTETEARAWCPALVSRPWVEAHVAAARHALCEAALALSPRVEDWSPGVVHVDAAGLGRLVGDPAAVGRKLARQARAVGLAARVALAPSRTAARLVAARATDAVTVVPPGGERAALGPLPLDVLGLEAELAATFAGWGIRTLGELAALPREGLGARLGPAALRAHDLACGLDREPFRPWTPPPFWAEAQELAWEVDTLGALAAVMETVLARLVARLAAAGLAADALEVRLGLATGGHHARTVRLACPAVEVRPLATLLALDLEGHPPPAPVTHVALSAHPVRLQPGPGGLWQPRLPALRDLAAVLARLAELVGPGNVGRARLDDSHRPDTFTLAPFALDAPPPPGGARPAGARPAGTRPAGARPVTRAPREDGARGRAGPEAPAPGLALRRLRPPRPVAVEADAEGRPTRVDGRRVVACAGPWRLTGGWWDAGAWGRDEWDAALADGTLGRLARDLLTGRWHLDGVYD